MNDKKEFLAMIKEEKLDYCDWCWESTCFNCYKCLIYQETVAKKNREDGGSGSMKLKSHTSDWRPE